MLKNIIGNKHAKKLLVRYLENANSEIDTPSSVLLYGHKGVGKSCIAKYMAKSLVGCSDIDTHPDIRYVDNLSTADELSELLTFCSYISIMGKYKVVILDNAEQIPIALQNKLLKTIEEPQNVIFIFVCNGALLNTIHSRTFNVCFSPVTEDELQKYIKQTGDNSLPLCIYDGSIGINHT